mmetsp:Transcript_93582/g.222473  ORF Transcript_93582/g.222473 Transcript_93582/m.222473 type:complete len:223 (-) Transcript_93582:223-891(-)
MGRTRAFPSGEVLHPHRRLHLVLLRKLEVSWLCNHPLQLFLRDTPHLPVLHGLVKRGGKIPASKAPVADHCAVVFLQCFQRALDTQQVDLSASCQAISIDSVQSSFENAKPIIDRRRHRKVNEPVNLNLSTGLLLEGVAAGGLTCGLRAVEELSVELPRQRRDRFDRVWPFLLVQQTGCIFIRIQRLKKSDCLQPKGGGILIHSVALLEIAGLHHPQSFITK